MSYQPTEHHPGSPEKIAILQARLAEHTHESLGEINDLPSLFVTGDCLDLREPQKNGSGPTAGRTKGRHIHYSDRRCNLSVQSLGRAFLPSESIPE